MLKRNWKHIDQRAREAKPNDAETYDKLVKFLEKPIKDDLDRDIYMTRALIYWLYCNENTNVDKQPADTPLKLLKDMHDNKVAYAVAFETLCSKARVTCKAVFGISKSGNYKPGDKDISKMSGSWNLVFLEGKWWPIYPRWVLQSLVGATHGDYRKIDSEGTAHDQKSNESSKGHIRTNFTEFWFLTDPQVFIYKCYPDKLDDQMLPKSKQVKRRNQFLKLPHVTLHFFEANLKITSEETCEVDSEEGVAKVSFKGNAIKAKGLTFEYTLFIKDSKQVDYFSKEHDQTRLVFNSRKGGHFMFEIRCPIEGTYLLQIKGGLVDATERKVYMVTKIICREKMKQIFPLPIDAGNIGFGFGPAAKAAGLKKPSIKEPKISIKSKSGKADLGTDDSIDIKFGIDKEMIKSNDYKVELHGLEKRSESLQEFVKTKLDKTRCELNIRVSVPDPGEYALVVKWADKETPGKERTFETACNYLLTTLENVETLADEYYDSSDGCSDMDDEIVELEKKVQQMMDKRDELVEKLSMRPSK